MNAQTIISSHQNSQVQLVRKLLSQSKARQREQAFVAEGVRLIQDGLRSGFPLRTMFKKENASPLADFVGKKKSGKRGVKVDVGDQEVTVDVYVIVEFGVRIPDVAHEIQRKVKSQLKT